MKDFAGKVVVVTGAASGIGSALADAFAKERARIVLADIQEVPLTDKERQLRDLGAEVLAVTTDVADGESVNALARQTLDRFGAVHMICNNAGVAQSMRPVWDFSVEYWKWFLGIDLWGVIHGIRTFVPLMLEQGGPCHVVNTASMAGVISYPIPFHGPYSAAKAAVISLSESLSADLKRKNSEIGVSVVCPGFVRTNLINLDRHRENGLFVEADTELEIASKWRSMEAEGADPEDVAVKVLNGIRENSLYIMTDLATNENMIAAMRLRTDEMISQRNPTLLLPLEE